MFAFIVSATATIATASMATLTNMESRDDCCKVGREILAIDIKWNHKDSKETKLMEEAMAYMNNYCDEGYTVDSDVALFAYECPVEWREPIKQWILGAYKVERRVRKIAPIQLLENAKKYMSEEIDLDEDMSVFNNLDDDEEDQVDNKVKAEYDEEEQVDNKVTADLSEEYAREQLRDALIQHNMPEDEVNEILYSGLEKVEALKRIGEWFAANPQQGAALSGPQQDAAKLNNEESHNLDPVHIQ